MCVCVFAIKHENLVLIQTTNDANIRNDDGKCALHVAAESGFGKIVKALIQCANCDTASRTSDNKTALH